MNRRKFLKSLCGLSFLMPFFNDSSYILGIDKAAQNSDKTVITQYCLDDYAKAAKITGVTFWHGPSNPMNCKCNLVCKEGGEKIG